MIYQVTLLTSLVIYVLSKTGVFPRYGPHIVITGVDLGPYIGMLLIFAGIAFMLWFTERSTGRPRWLQAMRYRQGASLYLDLFILAAALLFLSIALGAGTLSFYLISLTLGAIAGAIESIWLRAEPTHQPGADASTLVGQQAPEPPLRQEDLA